MLSFQRDFIQHACCGCFVGIYVYIFFLLLHLYRYFALLVSVALYISCFFSRIRFSAMRLLVAQW